MFKDLLNSNEFYEDLCQGDETAYGKLLRYGLRLLRSQYLDLGLSHLQDDLLSATVTKLWDTKCSGFDPSKSLFTTWFVTVGRRVASNERRRQECNRKMLLRMYEGTSADSNKHHKEKSGESPLRTLVRRAHHSLSDDDRLVLDMRFVENLEFDVISESLGIKESAARMRVSRALQRLENAIEGMADFELPQRVNRSKRRHPRGTMPAPHKGQQPVNTV